MQVENFQWKKASDIHRDHATFELMEGGLALLDVGFSDEDVFEISFNPAIGGKKIAVSTLLLLINEGRMIADGDK